MKLLLVFIWLLPVAITAAPMWLGTNQVFPGRIVEFVVTANARARMEAAQAHRVVSLLKGAVAVPEGFSLAKPRPILIVSVPSGGSPIRAMAGYTNVALPAGWVLLAGEGPRIPAEEDTVQWGWGMLSSVVDFTARNWPQTKAWPVACAGFSGGAKRSATVAAAMMKEGYTVIGVFMGGCNEDRVTLGLQMYQPGDRFKSVPLFLSNGNSDPIAGPQQAASVVAAMRRSGFVSIRSETFDGGHRQNYSHLVDALRWFKQPLGAR